MAPTDNDRDATSPAKAEDGGDFPWRITLAQAMVAPIEPGARSPLLLHHASLRLRYYQPRGHDPQSPHDQDELYLVARGHGRFVNGDRRHPFGPGDVLFVPAGVEHRFVECSDDFGTWVVFLGPAVGEAEV